MAIGQDKKVYYENKLDIIIYLLNSTDIDEVQMYLLDEYSKVYDKYIELIGGEHIVKNEQTSTSMDWI